MKRIALVVLAAFLLLTSGYSMRDWPGWASAFLQDQDEEQTDAPEIPDVPEFSYLKVNGEDLTQGGFIYSSVEDIGECFLVMGVTDSGDMALALALLVPAEQCAAGLTVGQRDLSDQVGIYFVVSDADGEREAYSFDKPEIFSDVACCLYEYEEGDQAVYYLRATVTDDSGVYEIEAAGQSPYVDPEDMQQSQSPDDGTCLYCGGTGICQTCSGLGYTGWGTSVSCYACGGTGECYYCQGTGVQVYITRGVPIS